MIISINICGHASGMAPGERLLEELRMAASDTAKVRLYLSLSKASEESELKKAYADSALAIAAVRNDSANIARANLNISRSYWEEENFGKALGYGLKAEAYLPEELEGSNDQINIFYQIGNVYNYLGTFDHAIAYYDKVETIVIPTGNKRLLAHLSNNKGVAYKDKGELDKALAAYLAAIEGYEGLKDTLNMVFAYHNIAEVYKMLDLPDKQLEYLLKHLSLSEKLNDNNILAASYLRLASFYSYRKELDRAEKYFKELQNIPDEAENLYFLINKYQNLSDIYFEIGKIDLAFENQYKVLDIVEKTGLNIEIATVHNSLAWLHTETGTNTPDSIFHHAQTAYRMASESDDAKTLSVAALRLAIYYDIVGNYTQAIKYGKEAFDGFSGLSLLSLSREASGLLAAAYEQTGNYKEANFYIRNYQSLSDSISGKENIRKIAYLSSQIEYEKQEGDLKTQIAIQQQKLHNQKIGGILMLCILGLLAILTYTNWRNARLRRKTNLTLQEQKEELEAFNEELSATNDELMSVNEKLHIAHKELELHREHLEDMVKSKTAKLQEALEQAQESDRFKAAFFANMSHEIRTPLNAILGFLQFIDDPELNAGKRKEMIQLVNSNAIQLLSMVDDIVNLSRIDSGLLVIQPKLSRINELLDNVSIEAGKMIRRSGKDKLELIIENRVPADNQTVFIDDKRVEQVLLNLIDNAVKFTGQGYILVTCEIDDKHSLLRFSVEDTGTGISEDHRDLIFNRFWKQGDLYTQSYRGIGIGLSLSEELVRLMHGSIHVESTPGTGSIFRFTVGYEQI